MQNPIISISKADKSHSLKKSYSYEIFIFDEVFSI
jgi:hypothetical protein